MRAMLTRRMGFLWELVEGGVCSLLDCDGLTNPASMSDDSSKRSRESHHRFPVVSLWLRSIVHKRGVSRPEA